MQTRPSTLEFTKAISHWLDVDSSQVFTYWKGRVGLYALLKAMGIKKGDEVILPAFTCVVVPNSIIYLGAKPIYVDIDRDSYNMNVAELKKAITKHTKCILIQNTFGLSSQVQEIVDLASELKIPTIEDCTHGFGGIYNGKPNGTLADASFYSTQWNKPFSTGIGGFVYLKNVYYLDNLRRVNKDLIKPSFRERTMLSLLITTRTILLKPVTYWFLLKTYRFLSRTGLVIGSSSKEEIEGINMPENYFKTMSSMQEKKGIKRLRKLQPVLTQRVKNAKLYTEFLKQKGKTFVSQELHVNHSFLKYPILVKDREKFKKLAEKANIKLGDWFVSMIHPIEKNFEQWNLQPDDFPVAKEISEKILNLDTDTNSIEKVLEFLAENKEELQ